MGDDNEACEERDWKVVGSLVAETSKLDVANVVMVSACLFEHWVSYEDVRMQ